MPMKRRSGASMLLLLCCATGSMIARCQSVNTAFLTISGAEQSPNGTPDSSNITVDFNGYLETVRYGQYSTAASLAAALGAMFTRDYYRFGLCAKAGANTKPELSCAASGTNENQNPNVVTFQLKNGSSFGSLNVAGSTTSFTLTSSGFGSVVSVADTGTVTLQVAGTAFSIPYGDGSTATTLAQGLANAAKGNSKVAVTANGADLYIQARQSGAASNYPFTLSAASSNPGAFPASFLSTPLMGALAGGADLNALGGTVYSYSVTNSTGGTGYDTNGNILNVSDSVIGTWQYGYDSLNRLIAADPSPSTGGNQHLCWSYDNFGNRLSQMVSTTACTSPPTTVTYSVANQITNAPNAPSGFSYDGAGNVTGDGTGATYLYDAEGRLCAMHGSQGMTGYQYDANGTRIGKGTITVMSCDLTANGYLPTNEYILDQSGAQMTEVAVDENGTEVPQHTNVTANGVLIATLDTVGWHYYLNDPLGTRRAQTDSAGVLEQTCQSLPFGDQLNCTQNLVAPTEHHFTGKERDTESGLDYFGARYYSSNMGRFMSPDWSGATVPVPYANLSNPQSLNLYEYAGNNPLSRFDPDGHNWFTDFLNGVANATYRPLVTAVEHPIITGRAVGNAVAHPIATAHALRNGVVTTSQQVMTGNGTAIGTAAGTVGMLFVPGVGEAGEAAEGAADLAKVGEVAGDSGSLMDLNKSLASQEQMGQVAAGQGDVMAGAGSSTTLRDSQRLAAQYGGDAGDWQKVNSGNYNPGGAKGGGFETHAYQNSKTGQVVEMKSKMQ